MKGSKIFSLKVYQQDYKAESCETYIKDGVMTLKITFKVPKIHSQKGEGIFGKDKEVISIKNDQRKLSALDEYPHEISYVPSRGPRRRKRIIHCKFPG